MRLIARLFKESSEEQLMFITKLIDIWIRNAMENFHVENLTDDQMKELNLIISIYNALFALSHIEDDPGIADMLDFTIKSIPAYWEDPVLGKYLSKIEGKIKARQGKAYRI